MECDGRLASGGDVKGWDRHEGGPGSSSVVDLEAILEGLLAHLIVVELIKNVLVTGGLVFDNVQEEVDEDDGDEDDERKRERGESGTRGEWSESHAAVKTCLCINSFKDAAPLPMAACSGYA
ncbi:hypothetical protein VitviT2T_011597 [Vitis vinifera]|uniref:Uncharacterized protein n=1 Tax=Vitis vinifera TaxID=29760 RepID=A0ABY9CC12_VITVI|nr:hypothetical protein VitviT2T_011597 [Vitis vinifera]